MRCISLIYENKHLLKANITQNPTPLFSGIVLVHFRLLKNLASVLCLSRLVKANWEVFQCVCVLLLFHFICIPILSLSSLFRNCSIFVSGIHLMHLLSKREWRQGSLCATLHWKCWTFSSNLFLSQPSVVPLIEFQISFRCIFQNCILT